MKGRKTGRVRSKRKGREGKGKERKGNRMDGNETVIKIFESKRPVLPFFYLFLFFYCYSPPFFYLFSFPKVHWVISPPTHWVR